MPEAKSRFLNKILETKEPDEEKTFTSERQHTALDLPPGLRQTVKTLFAVR
jgi:hypothetical protein